MAIWVPFVPRPLLPSGKKNRRRQGAEVVGNLGQILLVANLGVEPSFGRSWNEPRGQHPGPPDLFRLILNPAAVQKNDVLDGLPLRAGMASGNEDAPCLAAALMAQRPDDSLSHQAP